MPDEFQALKKERCIEIIKACNGSGMAKRQWCREHGISYSTFMRWQRSLRNELAGEIMVTQRWFRCQSSRKLPTVLLLRKSPYRKTVYPSACTEQVLIWSLPLSEDCHHVRRHYAGKECIHRLWTHRYAQRNPGACGACAAELSAGSHRQQPFSVLR